MFWTIECYGNQQLCRDSSDGIATRYEMDGPGIESRWRWNFPHPSRQAPRSIQPPVQWVPGFFPGVKETRAWGKPPNPSSAEVKERIELLTLFPSWGRDSSVGIATGYGLDGPGIESRRGRDFPHLSRPALGPTQPPVKWVRGLFWG